MKYILNINGTLYAIKKDGLDWWSVSVNASDHFDSMGDMGSCIELIASVEDMELQEVADLIGYNYETGKFLDNQ